MQITYLEYEEPDDYVTSDVFLYEDESREDYKEPLIDIFNMADYQLLKLKRICDDFTQAELGDILGIGPSTLSDIENSRRQIPHKHVTRIRSYIYDEIYENKKFQEYFKRW